MKVETLLFGVGALFFLPVGLIYGVLTEWQEPVGAVAIILTAGLAGLIGFYLAVTARHIDDRPEDDPFGEIEQGAGEMGFFSPHSVWPLAVALCAAIIFLGAAIGWWLSLIGAGLAVITTIGFVFEYSKGSNEAH